MSSPNLFETNYKQMSKKQRARHFAGSNPSLPQDKAGKSMRISASPDALAAFDSLSPLGRGDIVEHWHKYSYLVKLEQVRQKVLNALPASWFRRL